MYTTTLQMSCATVPHICWTSGTTHVSNCSFWGTPYCSHETARMYTMTLHMICTTVLHICWTSGTTHMSSKSAGLFWRSLLSCTGLFCRYWRYLQWMSDSSYILRVSFQRYRSLLRISFPIYGSPFSEMKLHPANVWQQLYFTRLFSEIWISFTGLFPIYGSPFSELEVHPDNVWQQIFLTGLFAEI